MAGTTALQALTGSFGTNFAPSGSDPLHGIYNAGNWRQTVPLWSMQIVSSAAGNIQMDVDPNNPDSGVGGWLGHLGNVIANFFTRGDTNYNAVATALQFRNPNLKIFNCP